MGSSCVTASHLSDPFSKPQNAPQAAATKPTKLSHNKKWEASLDTIRDPDEETEAELVQLPSRAPSSQPFGLTWTLGSEPAIELVIQGLEHEDPGVRRGCLSKLHRVCLKGDSRGVAAACSCFADADPGVRATAVEAVSHTAYRGDERAIVTLVSLREDKEPRVRKAVYHGLCGVCCQGDQLALASGIHGVNDADWRVRTAAVDLLECLGQENDGKALAAAFGCLKDSDADVRASALKAVGSLSSPGDGQAVEAVGRCMEARNWRVRQAAVQALQVLNREGNVHVLTMMRQRLRDKDPDVRLAAVLALGSACEKDDASFVLLRQQCSEDPDHSVRTAAKRLLIEHSRDTECLSHLEGESDAVTAPSPYRAPLGEGTDPQAVTMSVPPLAAWAEQQAARRFHASLAPRDGFDDFESASLFIAGPGRMNRRMRVAGDIVKIAAADHTCHRGLDCLHCAGLRRATVLAMSQMCTNGDKRAIATLHQRLEDFDPGVRQAAVEGMSHVFQKGDHTAIDALVRRLGDTDMYVRLAAIASLIKICPKGDVAAIDALTKCSTDEEKPVQLAAIGALGHIWPEGGEDVFVETLSSRLEEEEDPETKQALLKTVVQSSLTDKMVTPAVMRCLNHKDWRVRACAVSAIPEFCPPGANRGIVLARKGLKDADADVRVAAVVALGQLCLVADPKVAQLIIDKLKDKSWRVRCAAVEVLGSLGSSSSDERLLTLVMQRLTDKELEVRQATSQALARFAECGGTAPVKATRLANDGRRQTFL